MKTFKQHLLETRGRGTKGDQFAHYSGLSSSFEDWQRDAKKLGYHITHHESKTPPHPTTGYVHHSKWSVAHKIERGDPKQGYENHPHGPPSNRSRGTFWHNGYGQPHGYLRYKYMPTNEAVINTAQDKAQRKVFNGLAKKIIKPNLPKPTDMQKKLIKPMQSNVQNMINAIAGQPTGHHSSISPGEHV